MFFEQSMKVFISFSFNSFFHKFLFFQEGFLLDKKFGQVNLNQV